MKFFKPNSILIFISVFSFFFLWLFCTDPSQPDFNAPSIGNNKQIQTFGNAVLDSSFGMFITANGSGPLTIQWFKDGSPVSKNFRTQVNDT